MRICAACKKPFDEVHPLDFMNDLLVCADFNRDSHDPRACRKNHTWREHVTESWRGKWINPHFPIKVPDGPEYTIEQRAAVAILGGAIHHLMGSAGATWDAVQILMDKRREIHMEAANATS